MNVIKIKIKVKNDRIIILTYKYIIIIILMIIFTFSNDTIQFKLYFLLVYNEKKHSAVFVRNVIS